MFQECNLITVSPDNIIFLVSLKRRFHCNLSLSGGGSYGNQSDVFGQWFTWCQSCRHGGHANHIAQWFR